MLNTNIGYLDNCKLIKDNVLSHDDCYPVGFFWFVELSTCTVLLMIVQSPSKYIYHYLTEAVVFFIDRLPRLLNVFASSARARRNPHLK